MQSSKEVRKVLPLKDLVLWGGEVAVVALGINVVGQLGLSQVYSDISSQALPALDMLLSERSGLLKPETFKPLATGLGFVAGATVTTVSMPEVLYRLGGKIRLQGTGGYEARDGGREVDRLCVDGRIESNLQESVEPGAGLMGGGFVRDNMMALTLHNLAIEHPLKDFAIGYMLGRTAPAALLSGLITHTKALVTAIDSQNKGFLKENQLPHDKGCGWSATTSFLKHYLKFSGANHEQKIAWLDRLNKIDSLLNTMIWEPMMNTTATPLSFFSFIINPNFGTTSIHEYHEQN